MVGLTGPPESLPVCSDPPGRFVAWILPCCVHSGPSDDSEWMVTNRKLWNSRRGMLRGVRQLATRRRELLFQQPPTIAAAAVHRQVQAPHSGSRLNTSSCILRMANNLAAGRHVRPLSEAAFCRG